VPPAVGVPAPARTGISALTVAMKIVTLARTRSYGQWGVALRDVQPSFPHVSLTK
jgi:hypothetical protein